MLTEIFSIIGSVIAGETLLTEHSNKLNITRQNKSNAIKNNEATYYDGNNKLRSTQTNEQVHVRFENGYTKYIGLHSNTVYENTLDKRNAALKNKKYIYKEYPRGQFGTKLWKYDLEMKMPYNEKDHLPNLMFDGYKEIIYYPHTDKYGAVDVFKERIHKTIKYDDPEYDLYR